MQKKSGVEINSDAIERARREGVANDSSADLITALKSTPIPDEELSRNLFLYSDRRAYSRFLFLNELYQAAMKVHGSILTFGCRYGVNEVILNGLRDIYEPYNWNREIHTFDTFEGFPSVSSCDGKAKNGEFGVPAGYAAHLKSLVAHHRRASPLQQLMGVTIHEGDVTNTLPNFIQINPHILVSMVYLDLHLYEPTKLVLDQISSRVVRGGVIAFDELSVRDWPGETMAFLEWSKERGLDVRHSQYRSAAAYVIL